MHWLPMSVCLSVVLTSVVRPVVISSLVTNLLGAFEHIETGDWGLSALSH